MFCCPGFENHVLSAGERGIAILVEQTSHGILFEMQSRGVAYEDEVKLRSTPIDLKINVTCSVGMQYCPWCGRWLQELAKASPEAFIGLAKKHEKLRTPAI